MTKSNREIAESIIEKCAYMEGRVMGKFPLNYACDLITAALDEAGAKAQRYRKALDFYANKDNWDPHVDYRHEFSSMAEEDFERVDQVEDGEYILVAGKRAREALADIEEGK